MTDGREARTPTEQKMAQEQLGRGLGAEGGIPSPERLVSVPRCLGPNNPSRQPPLCYPHFTGEEPVLGLSSARRQAARGAAGISAQVCLSPKAVLFL